MEENTLKFSSRARVMCQEMNPYQPMHFLSRRYSSRMSKCIMCRFRKHRSKYHLHCDACDYDIHKNCYFLPRCRMSDVTKPHTLQKRYDDFSGCFTCGHDDLKDGMSYYYCYTCKLCFHKVCHLYPPQINHPFHPSHPLKLTFSSVSSYSDLKQLPSSWQEEPSDSETEPDASDDLSISDVRCKCCQRSLQEAFYHCSICNFSLNLTCTRNPPSFTILDPKSHDHTLTLFPRRISSPCDACGSSLGNTHDLFYTCLPCNFMVHRACIYLPRVIKITRHPHRLSLSSFLPSGIFPCGVCRLNINVTYGQFSCLKGCHYAVHSRCAVEGRIWDGKDLEGVPEEPDEDVEPFLKIDDDTIDHFSHNHYLRFHMSDNVRDEERFCQACILPILLSQSFYSCLQCKFILHEACASLPRKMDHPIHKHRLILHPIPPKPYEVVQIQFTSRGSEDHFTYIQDMFKCNGCDQLGYGFVYICNERGCKFELDARCASLPDPFIHGSHPHELFFNLTRGECMRCKSTRCSPYSIECMECKSFMGLKCATLPSVTYYKHDKHPLTLCYGEKGTTNGQYWCEICEAELDAKEWFYTCNDYCNVTAHVSCLLGKQIFLKPASFELKGILVSVVRNNKNTRPICYRCDRLSVEPFLFKFLDFSSCSFHCLWKRLKSEVLEY